MLKITYFYVIKVNKNDFVLEENVVSYLIKSFYFCKFESLQYICSPKIEKDISKMNLKTVFGK